MKTLVIALSLFFLTSCGDDSDYWATWGQSCDRTRDKGFALCESSEGGVGRCVSVDHYLSGQCWPACDNGSCEVGQPVIADRLQGCYCVQ